MAEEKYRSRIDRKIDRRVRQRRRRIAFIFLGFLLISLIFLAKVKFPNFFKVEPKKSSKRTEVALRQETSFLLVGSQRADSKEAAQDFLVLVHNPSQKTLKALSLSKETFVQVPGGGFKKLEKVLEEGLATVLATLNSLLEVKIEHYLKISAADFGETVSKNDFEAAFLKTAESDLSLEERLEASREIGKVKADKIKTFPLPVRRLSVGEEIYLEPKRGEIEKLVKEIWGKRAFSSQAKIMVLNGAGLPGVGREVAQLLSGEGYKIVDIKNAGNFDYPETRILVYRMPEEAERIKNLLKVGIIVERKISQDLTDITVVVGKDYQKTSP